MRQVAVDARDKNNRVQQFKVVTTILTPSIDGQQIAALYEHRWAGEVCHADYGERDNLYREGRGPIVVVPALLKLAHWCQQCKHSDSGGNSCDTSGKTLSPPRPARANQRVLLKDLWAALPPSKQEEVLRTLSRLVTQGVEGPAGRKEVGDEQHL